MDNEGTDWFTFCAETAVYCAEGIVAVLTWVVNALTYVGDFVNRCRELLVNNVFPVATSICFVFSSLYYWLWPDEPVKDVEITGVGMVFVVVSTILFYLLVTAAAFSLKSKAIAAEQNKFVFYVSRSSMSGFILVVCILFLTLNEWPGVFERTIFYSQMQLYVLLTVAMDFILRSTIVPFCPLANFAIEVSDLFTSIGVFSLCYDERLFALLMIERVVTSFFTFVIGVLQIIRCFTHSQNVQTALQRLVQASRWLQVIKAVMCISFACQVQHLTVRTALVARALDVLVYICAKFDHMIS